MIRFLLLFSFTCLSCTVQHALDELPPKPVQALFEKVDVIKEKVSLKNITTVEVHNLAGSIFVENSEGDSIEIDGEVHVLSARETVAESLSKKPKLVSSTKGEVARLHMSYPLDEYDIFYFPGTQGKSKKKLSEIRMIIPYEGRRVTFVSIPSPDAVQLYTNLHIKIPKGVQLIINNAVGAVHSKSFSGTLHIDTVQSSVLIQKGEGILQVQSAKGQVSVNSHEGVQVGKTGTGAIQLSKCSGSIEAVSGSGTISASSCDYEKSLFETGSGKIRISKTKANLEIRSGSGAIQCKDTVAKENVIIKSGSGKITVAGNLFQAKKIQLESGSGDIVLMSKPFPKLNMEAITASGSISISVPDMTLNEMDPRKITGSFIATADISPLPGIILRAGSGDISVSCSSN